MNKREIIQSNPDIIFEGFQNNGTLFEFVFSFLYNEEGYNIKIVNKNDDPLVIYRNMKMIDLHSQWDLKYNETYWKKLL